MIDNLLTQKQRSWNKKGANHDNGLSGIIIYSTAYFQLPTYFDIVRTLTAPVPSLAQGGGRHWLFCYYTASLKINQPPIEGEPSRRIWRIITTITPCHADKDHKRRPPPLSKLRTGITRVWELSQPDKWQLCPIIIYQHIGWENVGFYPSTLR